MSTAEANTASDLSLDSKVTVQSKVTMSNIIQPLGISIFVLNTDPALNTFCYFLFGTVFNVCHILFNLQYCGLNKLIVYIVY